jgi:hypothetical protein
VTLAAKEVWIVHFRAAGAELAGYSLECTAQANPLWRAPRIHGELQKLGIAVSERTVSRVLRTLKRPPSQTWKTFLRNHMSEIVAVDFFTVPTIPTDQQSKSTMTISGKNSPVIIGDSSGV